MKVSYTLVLLNIKISIKIYLLSPNFIFHKGKPIFFYITTKKTKIIIRIRYRRNTCCKLKFIIINQSNSVNKLYFIKILIMNIGNFCELSAFFSLATRNFTEFEFAIQRVKLFYENYGYIKPESLNKN